MSPKSRIRGETSRTLKAAVQRADDPSNTEGIGHAAFASRLRVALKSAGSLLAVAKSAGVSDSTIYLWLKGSEPSREKLIALARATGVSVEWLATGQGSMRTIGLPEYVLPKGALSSLAFHRAWLLAHLHFGSATFEDLVLSVVGDDSMEPTLRKGDQLLAVSATEAQNGIYLVVRRKARSGEKVLLAEADANGRVNLLSPARKAEPGENVAGKILIDARGQVANVPFVRRVEFTPDGADVRCDNSAYPLVLKWSPDDEDRPVEILERVVWYGRLI